MAASIGGEEDEKKTTKEDTEEERVFKIYFCLKIFLFLIMMPTTLTMVIKISNHSQLQYKTILLKGR